MTSTEVLKSYLASAQWHRSVHEAAMQREEGRIRELEAAIKKLTDAKSE